MSFFFQLARMCTDDWLQKADMERKDEEAREKDLAAWAEKLKADHSVRAPLASSSTFHIR